MLLVASVSVVNIPNRATAEETTYTIGIALPELETAYYEGLVEGINTASEEFEVEVMVLGADNDLETEAANVESLIEAGVDAIILSPVDATESLPLIETINEAEIPVFVIGQEAEGVISSIMVDNTASGETAAELLCENLEGEGTVLTFEAVSDIQIERAEGFTAYMEENCEAVEFVAVEIADLEADDIIDAVASALDDNDVDAVFALDAETTAATVSAFITTYSRGITLIGFDINEDTLAAVQMGVVNAVVAHNLTDIGFAGIEAVVNYLNEEEVEPVVTIEAIVVDGDTDMSKCGPFGCGGR